MTANIDHIDIDPQIPYDEDALRSGDPARLADYIGELVKRIKDKFEEITTIANYSIDLNDGEALYLGLKNSAGEYPNGTWRFMQDGDNLKRQVKIAGAWTDAGTFERPL